MAEKDKQQEVADPVDPNAGEPAEAQAFSQMGATFAERRKAREQFEARQVKRGTAEDKAVRSSSTRKK